MTKFTYWQRAKVAFQYIMPQLYLTQFAGWFAQQKWGAVTHFVIKAFAKKYNVDMSEAKKENFSDYESFNQFFIRELKDDARKINENPTALCLPADGRVSQIGHIDDERLLVEGNGNVSSTTDKVRVHYTGTLPDSTVFDSSVTRGQPVEFPANGVIKGWIETLSMMPVGSKWHLAIPHELAYGEQGAGAAIPPFSPLVFEVELLDIL